MALKRRAEDEAEGDEASGGPDAKRKVKALVNLVGESAAAGRGQPGPSTGAATSRAM